MRLAALSLSALPLVACGAAGSDIVAPTEAPSGAGDVASAVFEICGTAMNEGAAIDALPVAAKLGWELEPDLGGTAGSLDIMRQTAIRHPDTVHRIQLYEHDGPHEKFMGCQFMSTFSDDDFAVNPAAFDDMPGFEGRWEAMKENAMGRWSKRAGDTVLSVQVIQSGDTFSTISMNKFTLK